MHNGLELCVETLQTHWHSPFLYSYFTASHVCQSKSPKGKKVTTSLTFCHMSSLGSSSLDPIGYLEDDKISSEKIVDTNLHDACVRKIVSE